MVLSVAAAFAACLLHASAQSLKPLDRPQFRADANLILVPVTVMDGRGSIVKGLDAASFTILDNRQPQPIAAFYSEDAPSSIGIVLDVSGSTRNILDQEKAAIHAFLEFSNPEDDFFLVTVSSNPRVLADDAQRSSPNRGSRTLGKGGRRNSPLRHRLLRFAPVTVTSQAPPRAVGDLRRHG